MITLPGKWGHFFLKGNSLSSISSTKVYNQSSFWVHARFCLLEHGINFQEGRTSGAIQGKIVLEMSQLLWLFSESEEERQVYFPGSLYSGVGNVLGVSVLGVLE